MDRAAALLQRQGIGSGSLVASLAGTSADHVSLYLAILATGATVVPLPTSARAEAIERMYRDSGASILFVSEEHSETAVTTHVESIEEFFDRAKDFEALPPVAIRPDDIFDIIYSSGTTGAPKGIVHDHRYRARQIARMSTYAFGPTAVHIVPTPLYSNTTLTALIPALTFGATTILMRKFDAREFLELCELHRVTHTMMVPVQYGRVRSIQELDQYDMPTFREKISTSAPFPVPVLRDVLRRWPGRMVNMYSMTEGGVSITRDCVANPERLDTVGRPISGCEIRIVDEESKELPLGQTGEIVGRSPTMMCGYHNAPEKTEEACWRSPEGLDFIRTGDIGRIEADGFVRLLDRRRDIIISGGFNIYAIDLEVVLPCHPAIAEVAVVAVPSSSWGETPYGFVVLAHGATAEAEEIKEWVNARLGRTQRLDAIEFCDALPRNNIGKVLKRELRSAFWGDRRS